jgi:hypothetical protein
VEWGCVRRADRAQVSLGLVRSRGGAAYQGRGHDEEDVPVNDTADTGRVTFCSVSLPAAITSVSSMRIGMVLWNVLIGRRGSWMLALPGTAISRSLSKFDSRAGLGNSDRSISGFPA